MYGSEIVEVTRPNGRTMEIPNLTDRDGSLYMRGSSIVVIGGGTIDTDNLKTLIIQNVTYEIGEDAAGDKITCFLKTKNLIKNIK